MKKIILIIALFAGFNLSAQEIYNPNADAKKDIEKAVALAKSQNKRVLVQVGGNWCGWCKRMEKLFEETPELKTILDQKYVRVHLNYSKENKNEELLKKYDNPGRFGYPVLLVLDEKGHRIHTQDTGLLESCKEGESGYEMSKLITFLKQWAI